MATSIVLSGATSGSISLEAPAVAGTRTIVFPAESGTIRTTVSSGSIVQIKHNQFGTTTGALTGGVPIDNTIPLNTEGNAVTSLDTIITPTSSTNWLIIEVVLMCYITTTSTCVVGLFQDSGANALAVQACTIPSGYAVPVILRHKMLAGTTSATTFKVRAGGDSGVGAHTYINGTASGQLFGGVAASSITIWEVAP